MCRLSCRGVSACFISAKLSEVRFILAYNYNEHQYPYILGLQFSLWTFRPVGRYATDINAILTMFDINLCCKMFCNLSTLMVFLHPAQCLRRAFYVNPHRYVIGNIQSIDWYELHISSEWIVYRPSLNA